MITVLLACGESPRVPILPDIFSQFSSGGAVGYNYPEVLATYPQNSSLNVPVNSNFVIVFNEPINPATLSPNISITSSSAGLLANPGQYTVTPTAGNRAAQINFTYGGANPIPAGDIVTVTIGAGIQDLNAPPISMPATVISQFTAGTAQDIIAPVIFGAQTPTGAGIALTPAISIDFTESDQLDPSSLNEANFFLSTGGVLFPTGNPSTNPLLLTLIAPSRWRASLTVAPNNLAPNTLYRIDVIGGPNGVKDLSGNFLAGNLNWSFTTTVTPSDPFGGVPSITDPLAVNSVDNTNAYATWATSKPTIYTLRYGRGDTTPLSVSDLVNYETFRSVTLPLASGKRYWIRLNGLATPPADYFDIVGNSGTNSTGPFQFNTTTNDALVPLILTTVAGGAGNQSTVNTVSQTAAPNGVFVLWTDDSSGLHLSAQRYDSGPAAQWVGGRQIFWQAATNYTYLHGVDDGAQGIIILAATGGGIFAKRLNSAGAFDNWEGPTNATSAGLTIAVAGTNGKAVPVNAGLNRVLYAWNGATTIEAMIRDITGTPPTVRVSQFTLDDSTSPPLVIPDGSNNAIVIYNNGGKIYGHKIDGSGVITWGTRADTGAGTAVLTNGAGWPAFTVGTTRPGANPVPPPNDFGDLSAGMDWASQVAGHASFFIGATEGTAVLVDLIANTLSMAAAVTHINTRIAAAGLAGFTAYDADGTHIGFRSNATGPLATLNLHEIGGTTTNPSVLSTVGIGVIGTEDHLDYTGTGWATTSDTFTINVNSTGVKTVTLNTDCTTQAQVITAINNAFTTAAPSAVTGVQAYDAGGGRIGIRSLSTGAKQTFTLANGGGTALSPLGLSPGTYTGTANPLTAHLSNETIIDVQSDNSGGAVILYKFNGNSLFVQRVDSTGTIQFGASGYNDAAAPSNTSNEVMACFNTPVDGVIVVAQDNTGNDIWAERFGSSAWAGAYISNAANGGNQIFPRIFPNGANTIITWEDDRFLVGSASVGYSHNTGWGVFGMKINAATGVKDPAWRANTGGVGADEYNGVAVILNNSNVQFSPIGTKARVAPYSGGAQAILLWEDNRAFQGSDVLFIDLNGFTP